MTKRGGVKMSDTARWYVVHTYSGYENKVATSIENAVENRKLHDLICHLIYCLFFDLFPTFFTEHLPSPLF